MDLSKTPTYVRQDHTPMETLPRALVDQMANALDFWVKSGEDAAWNMSADALQALREYRRKKEQERQR